MRIRWHGMAGTQHSWAQTQQDYIRAMKEIGGHELYVKSTNGLEHFPDDLRDLLVPGYHGNLVQGPTDFITQEGQQIIVDPKHPIPEIPDKNMPYDLELAYTIFYQGPRRFNPESKARGVIWNFESSILPPGWHLYAESLDYILPSSQYSYDIFAANGIPKDKMIVVPHGVDTRVFNPDIPPFKLKTEKKVKLLHCARPHHRKLHELVIRGYLDTFTGDDDVCLVLKTSFVKPSKDKIFEVDVREILERETKGRKNMPEIEVVTTYVPHIGSLYTACDVSVSMSSCEGFWLPGLEAMACGMPVIAPRHGGQLQYMNDGNSLLIDTGEMKAPASMQYWVAHPEAVVGDPDIRHYKELLRRVYENMDEEKDRMKAPMEETVKKFNWKDASQLILDLPIPQKSRRINEKRKVLYIAPYNMVGGAEIWVLEALRRLDRTMYEPEFAFVSGTSTDFKQSVSELDVKIHDLSTQGRGAALKCLVEAGGYDIIHFYNSISVYNVLREAWKQGLRCRIVETVHSELKWSDSMTKVSSREKFVMMIVAVTNKLGRSLLKMDNKNVSVLPQQVDWDRFLNCPRSKDFLTELNIPIDKPVVGFVGRLSPEKNIPAVMQCARLLPNVSFIIVGEGPQAEPLKQMGQSLSNVFFVGQQKETEKFYSAFDLLILPSSMEGLPLVILESMAAGTPVIASDVGGISECVTDGVNGSVIWNHKDPRLFANSISQLLSNPMMWKQFSANARVVANAMKSKAQHTNINNVYNILFPRG